jgi:hypothetical protein
MFAADGREQAPWAFELNIAAMALAGVAWLTLVLGMRWELRTKAVAAPSGLATLALAGAAAIPGDAGHGEDDFFPGMLVLTIELAVVVALVAISAWQPEVHGRGVLRLVVVLWGTTAFGVIHVVAEYAIMIKFSDANWDSPPGFGYLTVATITISAILTAIMTLCTPQRGADDEPQTDPHSGSLTLA